MMEFIIEIEFLSAIIVASSSFLSGFITFIIFFKTNKKASNDTTSHSNSVASRLPSLISIEIILLFWYLMCCTPLMLFFWFYLPTHYNQISPKIYNIIGASIFLLSFIPIYTTHIIRIWLLKLKYNITSLSMLNQLGMIKWKDIRNTKWTKIYYKHKWTHNIKILIILSIIFDIIITSIYTVLLFINIDWRIYLNAIIFTPLTFCLIIGIYSLKSFNDPFNIFREEIIILSVWFTALLIYVILYYFLWDHFLVLFLTDTAWTIGVTFFGALSALISVIIHFYFNNKSIQTVQKNLPSLSIIVSTKEGLETFLKFLVTELSVENLEFFTLSMRWRHRLVLRDQRREKRKSSKQIQTKPILTKPQTNSTETHSDITSKIVNIDFNLKPSITETTTDLETATAQSIALHATTTAVPASPKLAGISEMKSSDNINTELASLKLTSVKFTSPKSVITATSQMLLSLHKRESANEAQTHLRQLPFPILTFEFLDRDVVKNKNETIDLQKKKSMDKSTTETSYVLEFSKTTTMLSPQVTQRALQMERNITDRETAVSVFFEQYDVMQNNKRRITELSKQHMRTASQPKHVFNDKMDVVISGKKKSYTVKIEHTPINEPISQTSISFKDYDLDTIERQITARSIGNSPEPPNMNITNSADTALSGSSHVNVNKSPVQITPFVTFTENKSFAAGKSLNTDDGADFILSSNDEEDEDTMETPLKQTSGITISGEKSKTKTTKSPTLHAQSEPIPLPADKFNTLQPIINDNYTIVKRLSVLNTGSWRNLPKTIEINENKTDKDVIITNINNNTLNGKKSNNKGWFDENNFDMYDEEWTEEFLSQKRVDYDRFNTLSEDINISFGARKNLRNFFQLYPTVRLFREVEICEYDNSFQNSWKDVWENLNDSLRRFHQSVYYQEWLTSNAANGLNVIPMHIN
eukprot:92250_1